MLRKLIFISVSYFNRVISVYICNKTSNNAKIAIDFHCFRTFTEKKCFEKIVFHCFRTTFCAKYFFLQNANQFEVARHQFSYIFTTL